MRVKPCVKSESYITPNIKTEKKNWINKSEQNNFSLLFKKNLFL